MKQNIVVPSGVLEKSKKGIELIKDAALRKYNTKIIKKPFDTICKKLTNINFDEYFIQGIVKILKNRQLEQENIKKKLKLEHSWGQSSSFICRNPYTGESNILGYKQENSRSATIEYYYNKQRQWLLVEAYEEYERYIKSLYAIVGYIDNSFWRVCEFGNISMPEISTKNIDWFKKRIERNNKGIDSILKQIKKKLPNIEKKEKQEKQNNLNPPLDLIMATMEHLRHIIVHNNGRTESKKEFIETIIKKLGLYNNGNYEEQIFNDLDRFFREDSIQLKQIYSQTKNSIGMNVIYGFDGFKILLSSLGSLLIIIQAEVELYLSDKKFIDIV